MDVRESFRQFQSIVMRLPSEEVRALDGVTRWGLFLMRGGFFFLIFIFKSVA